jgi:hypothetical protein
MGAHIFPLFEDALDDYLRQALPDFVPASIFAERREVDACRAWQGAHELPLVYDYAAQIVTVHSVDRDAFLSIEGRRPDGSIFGWAPHPNETSRLKTFVTLPTQRTCESLARAILTPLTSAQHVPPRNDRSVGNYEGNF